MPDDHCISPCHALEQLSEHMDMRIRQCSDDKDAKIDRVHGDLLGMKSEMHSLSQTVREAMDHLAKIASNTDKVSELIDLYERWSGFAWVIRSAGPIIFAIISLGVGAVIGFLAAMGKL